MTGKLVTREMLISIDDWERRVAVLEAGQLVEIYIEKIGRPKTTGNIYLGKVKDVVPGMDAAFVDIGKGRNAFMTAEEAFYEEAKDAHLPIDKLLKPKQSILAQVLKEEKKGKGSRVTSLLTLPGRFLVLMPYSENVGVSRRLPEECRDRLKEMAESVKPDGMGLVVRTAAEKAGEKDFADDLKNLLEIWSEIKNKSKKADAPSLIYKELDLPLRVVRDVFSADYTSLIIDSRHYYTRIAKYLENVAPDLKNLVKLYTGEIPLFTKFRVDDSIETVLARKVWLRSGGYLIIDATEALTTIDVNTGKYIGGRDLEETIFKTNKEAVVEIVRQIRLRDIGGIIIVDFIDMKEQSNKDELYQLFMEELKSDRAKSRVHEFSSLGLVEMTRKSIGESFEVIFRTCANCGGSGRILSDDTAAIILARKILSLCVKSKEEAFLLKVNAKMIPFLSEKKDPFLGKLKKLTGKKVLLIGDIEILSENFEIVFSGKETEINKFI